MLTYYKNTLQSKILRAAVALTTLTLGTAHAQDWIGPTPMDYANMNMSYSNTLINNAMIERMVRDNNRKGSKRSGTSTTKKKTTRGSTATTKRSSTATPKNTGKTAISPASFAYNATSSQRTSYRNAYINSLEKSKPTLAASLRKQFEKHDYNKIYNGLLSGTGLTSNNLADAFAAYTVLGWMVVNQRTSDPSPTFIAGTRRQWASALAGTGFAKNEDTRRRAAEELKIKTVLLHAGWNDARKLDQSAEYADTVDKLFQSQFKLKLRSMALDTTGFKMRK